MLEERQSVVAERTKLVEENRRYKTELMKLDRIRTSLNDIGSGELGSVMASSSSDPPAAGSIMTGGGTVEYKSMDGGTLYGSPTATSPVQRQHQELLARINQSVSASSVPLPTTSGGAAASSADAASSSSSSSSAAAAGVTVSRHRTGSVSIHVPARASADAASPAGNGSMLGLNASLSSPSRWASAAASPAAQGAASAAGALNGKQFFREARKRLPPAKFDSFLETIKALNAHTISRDEALETAAGLFTDDHDDLSAQFRGLLYGTQPV